MKNHQATPASPRVGGLKSSGTWLRMAGFKLALLALFAIGLLAPSAHAQTNMTIKPFQIRVEVPNGFSGTYFLLSNAVVRIPTNGATGLDGTGTNWIIANASLSSSGFTGCTPAILCSDLVTPVGSIPINLNTNNASKGTNVFISLTFDGSEPAGVSLVTLTISGAGLPNDSMVIPVEVGKIWAGNASGPGNWSDPTQWLGGGAPGSSDHVVFTDLNEQTNIFYGNGTGTTNQLSNSVVNASTVISSLRFALTNSVTNCQNLFISPNVSLSITGSDGFKILRDYPYWSLGKMIISIYGTNGTLVQSNESSSFSILSDAQQASTVDMSGLGNLYLDINRFYLSDYLGYPNYACLVYSNNYSSTTLGAGKPQRFYQVWNMAATNFIKATFVDPNNYTNSLSRNYALVLGHNEASGGGSGKDVEMTMGYSNVFNLDSVCVSGSYNLGADLYFRYTNSYAKFRNSDGMSRMSIFATADAGGAPTLPAGLGDNTKCGGSGSGVDFSQGRVDMLVDRIYCSMDASNVTVSGKGVSQTSGFEIGAGVVDANTVILGYQSQGTQTNQSYCYATMFVTNGGLLKVNNTLALGYATAAAGSLNAENNGYGQLNLYASTGWVNNVTVGGLTKVSGAGGTGKGNNISLFNGASLVVSNGIADSTPNGALGTLTLGGTGNNSLTLFINGHNPVIPLVYVTNLTAAGTGNKLVIGGIANETYPAYVPLIGGVGASAISSSSFDAGVIMPPGSGLHGTLVTSSSNTVDIQIINRTPNHLVWRGTPDGTGSANWDYTTKNWLDQVTGLMTNYDNPDIVAFDGTSGYATNINLAGGSVPLTPTVVNMTNTTSVYYTFTSAGGNQVLGGPALNKFGAGGVEVDGETTFTVQLNQGTLNGTSAGDVGGVSLASGTFMNYAGDIGGSVSCAGTGTSSGSIAGTLTVLSGGVFTNSGSLANTFAVQTNGFLFNSPSGSMGNIGVGTANSPQVAAGGTLVNNGSIGADFLGSILYVNGEFMDLGGGQDTITVQAVTIGAGATFIPGGGTTGTTTITHDGSGTTTVFDGTAMLVLGSTNVFELNPGGSPASTVLSVGHLSFGGSANTRSQNGCTLQFVNVGAPYAIGQRFTLFTEEPTDGGGVPPFNTGTSTNTYPSIIPASPGSGMTWDLSQLWVNGSIGIISNVGPTFTSSFYKDSTGTNFVSQFSWDPSLLGYRLETLNVPLSVGLTATNWGGVPGSWTNTSVIITNTIGTNNAVFYRLSFP